MKLENLVSPLDHGQVQRNFDTIEKDANASSIVEPMKLFTVASAQTVTLNYQQVGNVIVKITAALTIAFAGMTSGGVIYLTIHNTSGGLLALTWNGSILWQSAAPASLAAGAKVVLRCMCYGTAQSDIYIAY